jgi:hypothetical protein
MQFDRVKKPDLLVTDCPHHCYVFWQGIQKIPEVAVFGRGRKMKQ